MRARVVGALSLATVVLASAACSDSGDGRNTGGLGGVAPPTGGEPAPGAPSPDPGGGDTSNYSITVTAGDTDLRTKGSGLKECTSIEATVKNGDQAAEDVSVTFSAVGSDATSQAGAANPATASTNKDGVAKTSYCAGPDENQVVVQAKAGASSANSASIKIISVPTYRFSWKPLRDRAFALKTGALAGNAEGLAEHLAQGPIDTEKAKALALTLRGGGNDCSDLHFELTKDGNAVSGQTIRFQTQDDVPVGVKLARREATGLTAVNPTTKKTFAYADVESNLDGVFQLPVCSGQIPGTLVLSAMFKEPSGREHEVFSPVIVMSGGLANYGFMSLTYDGANARVIPADTFTNLQKTSPFIVRLGTLSDGSIIKTHPLSVMAEVGKVVVDGNGVPSDAGDVRFTLESLNTRGRRPFPVTNTLPDLQFNEATGYSACDPVLFPTSPTLFSTVAKNWRSTVVYHIKGSEYTHANNSTGVFDRSKAFGVWDVNQNGVFESTYDVITATPAGRTEASFKFYEDDWFFDLPSPFVDRNENGRYDAGEATVGNEYVAPNGEPDDDTLIWKSTVVPLYLGATSYSLQHSQISSVFFDPTTTNPDPKIGFEPSPGMIDYNQWLKDTFGTTRYSTVLPNRKYLPSDPDPTLEAHLFGFGPPIESSTTEKGINWETLFFHAHDKCGNPIPGGKKIGSRYEELYPALVGGRTVTTHFFLQPYDGLRESSKRLLAKSDGSSDTSMNQDVLEHPAAKAGFPIELDIQISPCENYCSGDLLPALAGSPPLYCSASAGRVWLDIEGDISISHGVTTNEFYEASRLSSAGITDPEDNKCGCANGATRTGSTCTCPSGTQLEGNNCVTPPVPTP
jgi:hypothetical protein